MIVSDQAVAEALSFVAGWLLREEAYWLCDTAGQVPPDLTIVEIGSYQGRSAISLALGAGPEGATVYCVDPHYFHMVGDLPFGPEDGTAFMRNILAAGVADRIRMIALPSQQAVRAWSAPIGLLFIDGAHEYEAVRDDFEDWSQFVTQQSLIAVHDSTGAWDGPTRVVQEALANGWRLWHTVGYTNILRRI